MGKKRCGGKDGKRYVGGMAVRSGEATYVDGGGVARPVVFRAQVRDGEISLGEVPPGAVVHVDGVALTWDPDRSLGRKGRKAFDPEHIAGTQGPDAARFYVVHTAEVLLDTKAGQGAYVSAVLDAVGTYAPGVADLQRDESTSDQSAHHTSHAPAADPGHGDANAAQDSGHMTGSGGAGAAGPTPSGRGPTGRGPVPLKIYPTLGEWGMKIRAMRFDTGALSLQPIRLGYGVDAHVDLFTGNVMALEFSFLGDAADSELDAGAMAVLERVGGAALASTISDMHDALAAGEEWDADQLDRDVVVDMDAAALWPSASACAFADFLDDLGDDLPADWAYAEACLGVASEETLPEGRLSRDGVRAEVIASSVGAHQALPGSAAPAVPAAGALAVPVESTSGTLVAAPEALVDDSVWGAMGAGLKAVPTEVVLNGELLSFPCPRTDDLTVDLSASLVQVWTRDPDGSDGVRPVLSQVVHNPGEAVEFHVDDSTGAALAGGLNVTRVSLPVLGSERQLTYAKECINLAALCGTADPHLGLQLLELSAMHSRSLGDTAFADATLDLGNVIRDRALPGLFASEELADAALALLKGSSPTVWQTLWAASSLSVSTPS